MRAWPRALLRIYAGSFPLDRGKDRVLRAAHRTPLFGDRASREIVPGLTLDLALTDYIERSMYYRGFYEAETVAAFRARLRPGATILDVGANIGQYALIAARAVGDDGLVVAFEPDARLRTRLIAHARRNDLERRIHVLPVAVTDLPGHAGFTPATGDNRGVGRLAADGAETVECVRLDDIWPSLGRARCDLVKLDIEGAELPALRGAEALLRAQRPALIVELNTVNARGFGYRPADLVAYLAEVGYDVFPIAGARTPLRPADAPAAANVIALARA